MVAMRPYPACRGSGAEWLGEVLASRNFRRIVNQGRIRRYHEMNRAGLPSGERPQPLGDGR